MTVFRFTVPMTAGVLDRSNWQQNGYSFYIVRYHISAQDRSLGGPLKAGEIIRSVSAPLGTKVELTDKVDFEFQITDFQSTLTTFFENSEELTELTGTICAELGISSAANISVEARPRLQKVMQYEWRTQATISRTSIETIKKTLSVTRRIENGDGRRYVAPAYYIERAIDCYVTHIDWLIVSYEKLGWFGNRQRVKLPSAEGLPHRRVHPNIMKVSPYTPVGRFKYWKPVESVEWIEESSYLNEVPFPDAVVVEPLNLHANFVAEISKEIPTLYHVAEKLFPRRYSEDAA